MNPEAEKLAEELVDWSNRAGCSGDAVVAGFADAVKQRDHVGAWAAMEPLAVLPSPNTNRATRLSWVAEVLLVIRNLAVFAPVALTWFAISLASTEFGEQVEQLQAENPTTEIDVSFFRVWQSSREWWRISHVALVDMLIIASVIVLTLLAFGLRSAANRREFQKLESLLAERRALAVRMKIALHGRRNATVDSVTESLAESLSDLTQAARDLGTIAERFEHASSGVTTLAPQIEKLNENVAELLARGVNDVSSAMSSLINTVRGLDGTVAGGLKETLESSVAAIGEVGGRIQDAGTSVEFGTKQLRIDLDAIHDRLVNLAAQIDLVGKGRASR